MLKHVVLARWKQGTTPGEIDDIAARARALIDIEGIESAEFHRNLDIGTHGLGRGIGGIIILGMRDLATYDRYLPHPLHLELGKAMMAGADELTIFDYESD